MHGASSSALAELVCHHDETVRCSKNVKAREASNKVCHGGEELEGHHWCELRQVSPEGRSRPLEGDVVRSSEIP